MMAGNLLFWVVRDKSHFGKERGNGRLCEDELLGYGGGSFECHKIYSTFRILQVSQVLLDISGAAE